ncbi:CotH kinase family protein [Flavicella sp.]|uniref:CotH kinase family protein n=1 Tax=Flavicella sp. TaxID=2957742 RepID=UPI00261EE35E|nr:CotH kinase family protein [Flavicella sp.]MDG1805715.1 CotH kinase family protein [Flavicella sp.]MDG2280754.1 CotH kinase family protein [Flavicella sp.]
MKINKIRYVAFAFLVVISVACKETIYVEADELESEIDVDDKEPGEGLADWTTDTHTKDGTINYEVVFPQDKVNRIDIVLTATEHASMQSDLASIVGSTQGGPGGGGGGNFSDEDPMYVACDFYFNNTQWYEVGVRYKGNSSLYSAYRSGNGKLPLRFKFDEFEDDYSEIKNQRFYGFQHLSMNSNYKDDSFMREKSACDLFRSFGVPAVKTAYYEIYVDEGNGTPIYYGLYTMDEVVFDTMLNSVFGSETGNCYKPDGDGAKFSSSGFTLNDFEKKTNDDEADWSDIQAMYDALHASTRTTDVESWKDGLEAVFDVQGFLKYLAVNNTIQNWDTYANMTHNYYLYHDPADDLIKWIVWDNNEAFNSSGGPAGAISIDMSEVSSDWPLISYLIAIPEYEENYKSYLEDFNNNYYVPNDMDAIYDNLSSLISSSATSEASGYTNLSGGTSAFISGVATIKAHCPTRNTVVTNYLNN